MRNDLRHPHSAQAGGITIMVALMLLVLLTIAAVGMSRNSFREIVTSGFSRQGAMARNVADSGIEWGILWIYNENGPAASGSAAQYAALQGNLLADETAAGVARNLAGGNYAPTGTQDPDVRVSQSADVTQGFTIGLTRMGKLPVTDTSALPDQNLNAASGAVQKNLPDLWAVRADAQVRQGDVTFIHAKEAWVSTDVRSQ